MSTPKKFFSGALPLAEISDSADSAGKTLQFVNCRIFRMGKLDDQHLWVRNGKIVDPRPIFFNERKCADLVVDCCGAIIAPGFIDIQINGAFGIDFSTYGSSQSEEEYTSNLEMVAKRLLQYGVTSFCPTLVSSKAELYHKVLPLLKRRAVGGGANILGAHLEGPFISTGKYGAHPRKNLLEFGDKSAVTVLNSVYGVGFQNNTAIITLAPELHGAFDAVQLLTGEYGLVVSLGHTKASLLESERAVTAGASAITHLFNAMHSYHHRDPGLIGLLASREIPPNRRVFYSIISDGIHTHDSALRIAHRTDPEGLVLVSDGVAALGLGDGDHMLGDSRVTVTGNVALLCSTAVEQRDLAGSVSSVHACLRHLIKAARCSLIEAVECATLHPAQLLNIEHSKGTLSFGADADFVVMVPSDLSLLATFVGGKLLWRKH